MRTSGLYRMAVAGPPLGAASLVRTSVGWLDVWSKHGPKLVKFGLQAWEPDDGAVAAEKKFSDELLEAVREATEVYVKEVQRGLEDLEEFSRPRARRRGARAKAAAPSPPGAASKGKASTRKASTAKASARRGSASTRVGKATGKPRGRAKARSNAKPASGRNRRNRQA